MGNDKVKNVSSSVGWFFHVLDEIKTFKKLNEWASFGFIIIFDVEITDDESRCYTQRYIREQLFQFYVKVGLGVLADDGGR